MSGITPVVYSRLNARENQLRFVQSSNFFVGNDETETYSELFERTMVFSLFLSNNDLLFQNFNVIIGFPTQKEQ